MSKRIFVDMDGTLCVWNVNAKETDIYKSGYFENLMPHIDVINAIEKLSKEAEIYVLSCVINEMAKTEKNTWLDRYAQFIDKDHRIFVPYGQSKREAVKDLSKNDIFLDDNTKNLNDVSQSCPSIKLLNGINAKGENKEKSWKGLTARYNDETSIINACKQALLCGENNTWYGKSYLS